MAIYLSNNFSLNMVDTTENLTLVRVRKVKPCDVPETAVSVIDHADIARMVSNALGHEVEAHRKNITVTFEDVLYVAQYKGTHLPKGAILLPEGAKIDFFEVTIRKGCNIGENSSDCEVCGAISWGHGCIK